MEAFNLLKLWGNAAARVDTDADITNIRGGATVHTAETDDDDNDSFFDLKLTAPVNAEDPHNFVESPNEVIFGASPKPRSPISLLRSSRVFSLGFKKSKLQKTEESSVSMATPKRNQKKSLPREQSKRFTLKCEFDNSLRSKMAKQSSSEPESLPDDSSKRFSKDVIQKYLKLINPLYVRVSKRHGEKMRLSTETPLTSPATATSPSYLQRKLAEEKEGSRTAVLRVVCRRLGKSRSGSSDGGIVPAAVSRRDDSLLLQHDGIESAILHCKRSFNSCPEGAFSHGKSMNSWTKCVEEEKRCSI